jgi:superfamily II DNA or RNA helicase
MLTIIVDSKLRIHQDAISEPVAQSIRNAFTHSNPAWYRKRQMGYYPGKADPQVIRTYQEDDEFLSVPRGGAAKLRAIFRKEHTAFKFSDRSVELEEVSIPEHKLTLYPYQQEAVDACIARRNCLLRSPTGSGKTTVGINLISKLGQPAVIIVWSSALAKQWIDRLQSELGMSKKDIGSIMGGKVNIKPVTVAMQQSLYSKGVEALGIDNRFGVVVADEVQRFAAPTFCETIEPFKAKWRIGISADETRHDGKEFLIYDVFGQLAYEIDQTPLVEAGYIHEVEIRIIPTEFKADWYAYDKNFTRLTEEMGADPIRNGYVMEALRMAFADGGSSAMVFSHRVQHCKRIDYLCATAGLNSGLMVGGVENSKAFDDAAAGIRNGSVKVGIGTIQAIGQGIDIPAVDRGVIATPITSNRQQFGQVRGRLCRTGKGKDGAIAYYLWDQHVYGLRPIQNLMKWNKKVAVFNGGSWVDGHQYVKLYRQIRRQQLAGNC